MNLTAPIFAPLHRTPSFHFAPDTGATAGVATTEAQPGADARDKATESKESQQTSYAEAQKLIRERDRAKAVNQALVGALGLKVTWVEKEEGKSEPVIEGLDAITGLLKGKAEAEEAELKKAGKWEDRKKQLDDHYAAQIAARDAAAKKKVDGLSRHIEQSSVISPLRAAAAAEGAIDDDGGKFDDIVSLLSPRIKTTVEFDDETGAPSVTVQPTDEAGKPLLEADGTPISIRKFVASFLDKRPKYRAPQARRGPGAGGHGAGASAASGGARETKEEIGGESAAKYLFGGSRVAPAGNVQRVR